MSTATDGTTTARSLTAWRIVLGVAGAGAAAYGLWLLVQEPFERLVAIVVWAGGAVVAHDAVIAVVVIGLGLLVATRAPDWLRVPLVRLLVVLGPLTLVAVPVLGRFGARPDNPTLLDRPYWAGYLGIVAVALVLTAVDATRRRAAAVDATTTTDAGSTPDEPG